MDQLNENTIGKCAICNIETNFKCTACKNIFYCGIEHQKNHWKVHKKECRPFKIANSNELGRHIVATRDIPAKSIIFIEQPIVTGPKWCTDEDCKNIPIFPCVGCYLPVRIGNSVCSRCKWPSCSIDCYGLKNPLLHGLECAVLSTRKAPDNFSDYNDFLNYYRSEALLTLRCLLLYYNHPQKWKQLMELESHDDKREGTKYYEEAEIRIVSYLKENYLDNIKAKEKPENRNLFLPNCDAHDLHRICGIMEVNALNIELSNGQEITALYPTGCLLEHSCTPNCLYSFNFEKYKIIMRAGRDIKKGEHLSIMYTHMLWGTQMRHEHLLTNKYFVCKCERCMDPTELGTNLSTLKCIGIDDGSECGGDLLPMDPQNFATDWLCNKCPARIANKQVDILLSNVEEEVDTLMQKTPLQCKELEDIIYKLEHFLHKSHFHIFTLKHSLIQLYGHDPDFSTESHNQLKIDLCNDLLNIVDTIDPHSIRLSLYTGIILYELQDAIVQLYKLNKEKESGTETGLSSVTTDNLKLAFNYLKRAELILENNNDIPKGQKFIESVKLASDKLIKMIN